MHSSPARLQRTRVYLEMAIQTASQLIFPKICVIIELLIHNMGFDGFLAQGMGDGDAVVPVLNVVGIPNL